MSTRLLLIDPTAGTRVELAKRLETLGYAVVQAEEGIAGAGMALADPPDAVIADLWTPGASGVQICRFLGSETATARVPVLLRGDETDRRNRFWAMRAGAAALVGKGRTGELLRVLERALADRPPRDEFFVQLAGGATDVRERIARHLDKALFESVIAAELRSLAACDTPLRLFDRLTQFVSQVHTYRWLALYAPELSFFGVHHHPTGGDAAEENARIVLGVGADQAALRLGDDDTSDDLPKFDPVTAKVLLGAVEVGRVAVSPARGADAGARALARVLSSELGAPLRVTALVEQTRRLASTDALTGLLNRRAFAAWIALEGPRVERYGHELSIALLDVDHFKSVNDRFGHAAGDQVLVEVAAAAKDALRTADVVARWGGEEIVVALPSTGAGGAATACERVRAAIEGRTIVTDAGVRVPVTASIGVATRQAGESVDELVNRADAAMYRAKAGGRNRVEQDGASGVSPPLQSCA